jgi:DNA-binding transcriptional LysR family regulator
MALDAPGSMMELRHLRYFVAVAEELNFRRAAERMYVAQGAFSEQVRKFEGELGVRLLDRTSRGASLTDAAALLPEARRVLHQAEVARLAARNARDHATSRLRIGYMPASLPASVPRAVQRLAAAMPLLETSFERGSCHELIEAIRAEWLDAAVVSLPAPTAGLRMTPLGDQRGVAALPVSHEQARRPEIRLEQLAPERIVVLPREANRPLYDEILAACRAAGLSPSLVEMPDAHVEQALLAVASGAGLALLPESVDERYGTPGVRFVPLGGDTATFATGVVTRRDSEHMPTVAFLRAVSALAKAQGAGASRDAPSTDSRGSAARGPCDEAEAAEAVCAATCARRCRHRRLHPMARGVCRGPERLSPMGRRERGGKAIRVRRLQRRAESRRTRSYALRPPDGPRRPAPGNGTGPSTGPDPDQLRSGIARWPQQP